MSALHSQIMISVIVESASSIGVATNGKVSARYVRIRVMYLIEDGCTVLLDP